MTETLNVAATLLLPLSRDGVSVCDATGTSWDSAREALALGVIGLCGCGHSATIAEHLADLVLQGPTEAAADVREQGGALYCELLLHLLDNAGLTEHGTALPYAWLTPLGERWRDEIAQDPDS